MNDDGLRLFRDRSRLQVLLSPALYPEGVETAPPADQDSLKRLYDDIFGGDVVELRDYCAAEPAWAPAVAWLDADGGAGWDVVGLALGATRPGGASFLTARSLLDSPFFK